MWQGERAFQKVRSYFYDLGKNGGNMLEGLAASVRSHRKTATITLASLIALLAFLAATCAATRDNGDATAGQQTGERVAELAQQLRAEDEAAARWAKDRAAKAAAEEARRRAEAAKRTTTTKVPLTVQPNPSPVVTTPEEADLGELVNFGEKLGAAVADTGPEAWPTGCCSPLTGLGFDAESYANRSALAMKVSNSPSADPQTGLYRADLIYEIKVEGFSRLIAVYHSRSIGDIGPLRSGRTSDPPILHGLGQPLVANSGGNATVLARFDEAEQNGWLINLPRGGPAYYRSTDRVAPHNFYGIADSLWSYGGGQVPKPQFDFLLTGDTNPTAVRVSSVSTKINRVPSTFTWDPGSGFFLRSQYGRPHTDNVTGHRVARTSVVVLGTAYGVSGADRRSPEAISTWTGGEAWVFTGGTYIHGKWGRGESTDSFHLVDDQNRPIKLFAGPIWVSLVDQAPTWR